MTEHNPDYMPNAAEVMRFMRSNPIASFESLTEILGLGSEDMAAVSGGRLRELWTLSGGAVDKKGRAWIEVHLLPAVLRKIVDTVNEIDAK